MNEPLTLDRFFSSPRLSGLRLSPDGRRLVVAVSRTGPEANEYKTALWQVDPAGAAAPRRLTRSAAGESSAAFARDGSLLFTSARPDPDVKADPEHKIAALWHLPIEGGEARLLLAPEGGVEGALAARDADVVALGISVHPLAANLEEDAARAKARKEAKVGALLFDSYPIRYWDHWLAPQRLRLFAGPLPEDPEAKLEPVDLTGDPGPAFLDADFDISPDGRKVVTSWFDWSDLPKGPQDLYAIDVATKARRKLTAGDGYYAQPKVSPDGRWVACTHATFGAPGEAAERMIWLIDLATGKGRSLTPELDLWPEAPVWADDSSAVFFVGERLGHYAAFRVDLAGGSGGAVECLVPEGSVTDLCPAPDGNTVYALYATMSHPARIVRFNARGENQTPVELSRGIDDGKIAGRGRVERLSAVATDGQPVGSWLVSPPDASPEKPAPVVVFAHGGPIGSWSGWHWRWNPHLLVERGYAVLLPDPAISIGYGQRMVQRGWGLWGEAPYTDIMSALDGALARPDLDSERVALAGGSYGGYMANWVAGHTDRFKAIVTHASIWETRGFHGTTDMGTDWEHEMGDPYRQPELYDRQSPAPNVGAIKTPMLVIHGERDFRVPLSEALTLWTDLTRYGVPARFLYFPDENHWVLKPNNARLWYETVLAFLDEHVLGKEFVRPELL
jgi:dipeptidyl aminopeptidase/acylaminoacyl peptidase